jgi:hypothetical protein
MGREHLATVIGIATGFCIATPSWSQVRLSPSTADRVPGSVDCDPPDVNHRNIVVEAMREGIWKGFILFKVSCGKITGELFFGKGSDSLRYVVTRGSHQDFDAASIPISMRSRMLRMLLERLFDVTGRQPVYSFATSAFPEIGARLAAASAESPSWDRETGRARNATTSDFARRLMNEKETYPELANVFSIFSYNSRVSGTEDILILAVDRMNAADKSFINVHLLPTDKLPVSTATYFRIERR